MAPSIIERLISAISSIFIALIKRPPKPTPPSANSPGIGVTVHVADRNGTTAVPGAKVVLLPADGAQAQYTDGNGIASFSLVRPSKANARLFVESSRFEIFDQNIQLVGDQSVDIRLTPKGSNDHKIIFRVVDDSNGLPIDGAQVVLLVASNTNSQATDSNGIAKFTITFTDSTIEADVSVSTQNHTIERQRLTLRPETVQDMRLDPNADKLKITSFISNHSASPTGPGIKTISYGQTLTGSIDLPTAFDKYSFSAKANDAVLIRVSKVSGDFSPEIYLHGPDNKQLAGTDSFPGWTTAQINITLQVDGIYVLFVGDKKDYGTRTGQFYFTLQKVN